MGQNCICLECSKHKEIDGFSSAWDYERFEKYILDLITKKKLIQLSYERKWFWIRKLQCSACMQVWVLTEPDFPFRGYWGRLESFEVKCN